MRILAIDVGMGTQDILLYDSNKNIENCFKMVLPSQTQIIAKRISGKQICIKISCWWGKPWVVDLVQQQLDAILKQTFSICHRTGSTHVK